MTLEVSGSAWKCAEVPGSARKCAEVAGMGFENLDGLARQVLWNLPCEPNGLSVHELADGLCGFRGPRDLALVRGALRRIDEVIDLAIRIGDDDFGHASVSLYGIARDRMAAVRRLAASVGAYAAE